MDKKLLLVLFAAVLMVGCVQDVSEVVQEKEEVKEKLEEVEEVKSPMPVEEANVEETVVEEIVTDESAEAPVEKKELLIKVKTLDERVKEAYDRLHDPGSAQGILDNFIDAVHVYTDNPEDSMFYPKEILPFEYYYSEEADKTFNLCAIGRSVFICDGKLERKISKEDIDSGRCIVTDEYLGDPDFGGSGGHGPVGYGDYRR